MAVKHVKTEKGGIVKRGTEYSLAITAKLIEAFHNDYTIEAACRYAGCTRASYYNWLEKYPEFAEKMEAAQNQLSVRAGEVTAAAIAGGDVATARWYKDRRDPRYKPKGEFDMNHAMRETREKITEFLDDTNDGAPDAKRIEHAATASADDDGEVAQPASDIRK